MSGVRSLLVVGAYNLKLEGSGVESWVVLKSKSQYTDMSDTEG